MAKRKRSDYHSQSHVMNKIPLWHVTCLIGIPGLTLTHHRVMAIKRFQDIERRLRREFKSRPGRYRLIEIVSAYKEDYYPTVQRGESDYSNQ